MYSYSHHRMCEAYALSQDPQKKLPHTVKRMLSRAETKEKGQCLGRHVLGKSKADLGGKALGSN